MNRRDLLLLLLVLLAAGALRGFQLSKPSGYVFDEWGYARDACFYLGLGEHSCGIDTELSDEHPPLGKWIIASGIAAVGNNPIGRRIPSVLAGVLSVGLLYLLARRLLISTSAALVASALLALDPLSIITSRIAMLDVFVTCAGLAAVLCLTIDRDAMIATMGRRASLRRPWLAATGITLGCAVATKWSAALVVITVLTLAAVFELGYARRTGEPLRSALRGAPAVLLWLVLTPALVYAAAFIGRLDGTAGVPWDAGSWLGALLERQSFMLDFHTNLSGTHPYASPAWSWPVGKRPVLFFFDRDDAGRYREILAPADPIVWLPAFAAAAAAAFMVARDRRWLAPEVVVAACVIGTYVPWLALTAGRSFVFLYYMTPTIPFLGLALGWATTLLRGRAGSATTAVVLALALAIVVFWRPVIYADWLKYDQWRQRMLFTDCTAAQVTDRQWLPSFTGEPPPGWCWV